MLIKCLFHDNKINTLRKGILIIFMIVVKSLNYKENTLLISYFKSKIIVQLLLKIYLNNKKSSL